MSHIDTVKNIEPVFLNEQEVARVTGLSRSWLSKLRMIGGGDGPPFTHIGRRVAYPTAELRQWAAERTAAGVR